MAKQNHRFVLPVTVRWQSGGVSDAGDLYNTTNWMVRQYKIKSLGCSSFLLPDPRCCQWRGQLTGPGPFRIRSSTADFSVDRTRLHCNCCARRCIAPTASWCAFVRCAFLEKVSKSTSQDKPVCLLSLPWIKRLKVLDANATPIGRRPLCHFTVESVPVINLSW